MTRLQKTGFYAGLTAGLTALGWHAQRGMLRAAAEDWTAGLAEAFLRALRWELLTAVVLLGAGIFLLRSRRRDGRSGADGWYFTLLGGAALTAGLLLFLLYGGMENAAADDGETAVNWLICLWTLLPAAGLIRTAAAAAGLRDEPPARRRGMRFLCLLLALGMLALIAAGQTTRFVHPPAAMAVGLLRSLAG